MFDLTRGFDKIQAVIIVFINAGRNSENIWVENNVFGREANLFDEDFIGALADFDFSGFGVCLAFFIERHDDNRRTITTHQFGVLDKGFLAFFQRDGINHAFTLDTFQSRFQNIPFGRIQHDGYFGDVRLRSNQHQKAYHRFFGLQHAFIHVDVDNLRTVFNLLFRDIQRGFKITFNNQPFECGRAGDIGAFTDIHKKCIRAYRHRLKPCQATALFNIRYDSRGIFLHGINNRLDMRGRGSATSANNIQITALRPIFQLLSHGFGRFIIFAKFIGQTGVGMGGHMGIANGG